MVYVTHYTVFKVVCTELRSALAVAGRCIGYVGILACTNVLKYFSYESPGLIFAIENKLVWLSGVDLGIFVTSSTLKPKYI